MGMAWTRSNNMSKSSDFLDTFPEHVHGVDMFQVRAHDYFTYRYRQFYITYPKIVETLSPESQHPPPRTAWQGSRA